MKGYVAHKGDRWYAVIYEGLDPVTGREQRSWQADHRSTGDRGRARRRGVVAESRSGRWRVDLVVDAEKRSELGDDEHERGHRGCCDDCAVEPVRGVVGMVAGVATPRRW